MNKLETTISLPLIQWEDGSIRVTGSRIPIDTVIHHFKLGATEEINYKFPPLQLSDIYGVIHYYLTNRVGVEEYLRRQEADSDAVQERIESDPEYQRWKTEIRERLLSHQTQRSGLVTPRSKE